MHLNLLDIPALYINLDSQPERAEQTERTLRELGFKTVIRIPATDKGPKGRLLVAHALGRSNIDALLKVPPPFIIFEDDIVPLSFSPTLRLPQDADAVLLGNMQWGYQHRDFSVEPYLPSPIVTPVEGYDDLYKVESMLSLHAMLYIKPDFVGQALRYAYGVANKAYWYHYDCTLSDRLYPVTNVYTVGMPMFYQHGKYESITNKHVMDYVTNPLAMVDFFKSQQLISKPPLEQKP